MGAAVHVSSCDMEPWPAITPAGDRLLARQTEVSVLRWEVTIFFVVGRQSAFYWDVSQSVLVITGNPERSA